VLVGLEVDSVGAAEPAVGVDAVGVEGLASPHAASSSITRRSKNGTRRVIDISFLRHALRQYKAGMGRADVFMD
jgi:hypothetical protein